ncbi:MAG: hypothetical protein ACLQFW_13020 [Xanthobacteraceae bacterium]
MRTEPGVTVECLHCGHVAVLTHERLSRLAIAPNTPIVKFVKRLRCRKCGSQWPRFDPPFARSKKNVRRISAPGQHSSSVS